MHPRSRINARKSLSDADRGRAPSLYRRDKRPDPEDAPHYLAAVQNVMERWGQVAPRRNRRR